MRAEEEVMGRSDEKMESVTPPGETKAWGRESGTVPCESVATGSRRDPRYPPLPAESKLGRHSSGMRTAVGGVDSGLVMMQSSYPMAQTNAQGPSTYEMLVEQQKLNQHLQLELSKVRYEVEKLREALFEYEWERQQKETPRAQTRYWTPEEHERFIDALKRFGPKDVRAIASYVGTRNPTQVRTHAQKYFLRVQREYKSTTGQGGSEMSKSRRRCMSEGDLTKVEKRHQSKEPRDEEEAPESAPNRMQASPLSKHPSGIDLLSLVAAETVKNEAKVASTGE